MDPFEHLPSLTPSRAMHRTPYRTPPELYFQPVPVHREVGTLQAFTLFPLLPLELRAMIWHETSLSKLREFFDSDLPSDPPLSKGFSEHFVSRILPDIFSLLQVNREAREHAKGIIKEGWSGNPELIPECLTGRSDILIFNTGQDFIRFFIGKAVRNERVSVDHIRCIMIERSWTRYKNFLARLLIRQSVPRLRKVLLNTSGCKRSERESLPRDVRFIFMDSITDGFGLPDWNVVAVSWNYDAPNIKMKLTTIIDRPY